MVEKIIYAFFGILAVLAGFVCMLGYAIPSLQEFRRADIPFVETLLGCALIWALALSACYMGYRCLRRLFSN